MAHSFHTNINQIGILMIYYTVLYYYYYYYYYYFYIYILYIFVQFNHFQQWKPPLCALKRIAPTAEPVALRFHLLEGAETLLRLLRLCEALDDGRVDHLGITENHRGSPGHKR